MNKLIFAFLALALVAQDARAQMPPGGASATDAEAYSRVVQSATAVSSSVRALFNDMTALITSWQKEGADQAERLAWWGKCAKQVECLDWLRLGVNAP